MVTKRYNIYSQSDENVGRHQNLKCLFSTPVGHMPLFDQLMQNSWDASKCKLMNTKYAYSCQGGRANAKMDDKKRNVLYLHTQHNISIWTVTPFLGIPPKWVWNETISMCFKFRFSALIWRYLHPNLMNGVGIIDIRICTFQRAKVIGQLAVQLFLGQMHVIPFVIPQISWKKASILSVVFSFGICYWYQSSWWPKRWQCQWRPGQRP